MVISSDAKPDVTPQSPKDRQRLCFRVALWTDQQDFALLHKHWEIVRDGAKLLPGSTGITGPPQPKAHWRQVHLCTGYRKFDAESTVLFDH